MKNLMLLAFFAPALSLAAPNTTQTTQTTLEEPDLKELSQTLEESEIDDMNFDQEFSDEQVQGLFIEDDENAPQTTQGNAPESEEEILDL